jgi:hypothetical protein
LNLGEKNTQRTAGRNVSSNRDPMIPVAMNAAVANKSFAEPCLLKKTQLKENIPSYLLLIRSDSQYWPLSGILRQLSSTTKSTPD